MFNLHATAQVGDSAIVALQSINEINQNPALSLDQKLSEFNLLIDLESQRQIPDHHYLLMLNEQTFKLMYDLGKYVEIKEAFRLLNTPPRIRDNKSSINLYFRLNIYAANALLMLQNYESAKSILSTTPEYIANDNITIENKAFGNMALGQFFVRTGKYKDGLKSLQRAASLYQQSTNLTAKAKTKKVSSALMYIGNTYYTMGDYKNAIKFYERSMFSMGELADPIDIIVNHHNIALNRLMLEQWEEAIEIAELAAQKAKEIESEMYFAFLNEILARAKHGLGKTSQAIEIIAVSTDIYRKTNYSQKIIEALSFETEFLISLDRWDDAFRATEEALAELNESGSETQGTIELYQSRYLVHERRQEYQKALSFYKAMTALKESDYQTKKEQEAQRLMVQYEVELTQSNARQLSQDNKIKSIIIKKNESMNRFLSIAIFVSLFLVVLLMYVYKRERATKLSMEELAMTDALTGCPNRRNIMQQAKALLGKQNKQFSPLGIALIDIDNFKNINDSFGHEVGDTVLKNFTQIVQQNMRDTDVLGRYGGEEFILILPNAETQDVTFVFERIQKALKQHVCKIENQEITLPITVSMGASVVQSVSVDGANNNLSKFLSMIINKADKKVYEAKELGKNQLKVASI